MKSDKEKELTVNLKKSYRARKSDIERRLREFNKIWLNGTDEELFYELCFCILTPQSKAKVCWESVENLIKNEILFLKNSKDIAKYLYGVRFKNNKAEYILYARNFFLKNREIKIKTELESFKNTFKTREWLVKNVKGVGYKEASHFLRNIGLGEDLTILDRHILKNLKKYGVIDKIPKSLSKKKYLEIEEKMKNFSKEIDIPLDHLDLLFWSEETGEVFK